MNTSCTTGEITHAVLREQVWDRLFMKFESCPIQDVRYSLVARAFDLVLPTIHAVVDVAHEREGGYWMPNALTIIPSDNLEPIWNRIEEVWLEVQACVACN